MARENVFFTGSAGTGKSVLLRAIVKAFTQKRKQAEAKIGYGEIEAKRVDGKAVSEWELAITATTGLAGVSVACSKRKWRG